jgi:hypothetical protein
MCEKENKPEVITEPDYISDLESIQKLVEKYIRGDVIDKEQLSVDIWTELWEHKNPITKICVRHRCYDKLRILRKNLSVDFSSLGDGTDDAFVIDKEFVDTEEESISMVDVINTIVKHTPLSKNEQLIILWYFYYGEIMPVIASKMNKSISFVQVTLKKAIEKLRNTYFLYEELQNGHD